MKKTLLAIIIIICACQSFDTSAQSLVDTVNKRKKELAEQQRIEKENYEQACAAGTLSAFQGYLNKYPNGKYAQDIKDRIADFSSWDKAKKENTIAGYENYIATSQFKFFQSEANDAIIELKSIEAWNKVKDSDSIGAIEGFIREYPNSTQKGAAQKRIHELKGIQAYNASDLRTAYKEFEAAGGRSAIATSSKQMYDKSKEYNDYKNLSYTASESDLLAFMKAYPDSKYYNEISNRIALIRAKALSMFSSQSSYDEALRYATDSQTRNQVNDYINASKKSYSQYQSEQRRRRIRENGGVFNMGIDFMDIAGNLNAESCEMQPIAFYNLAVALRVGNYKSPLQFEIGLRPGVGVGAFEGYDYYDSYKKYKVYFRMPAYAKLNLNLFGRSYISGAGFYNLVTDKKFEKPYAYQIGFGVHWKHTDWLILYYMREFGEFKEFKSYGVRDSAQYLGMGLIYYFQF